MFVTRKPADTQLLPVKSSKKKKKKKKSKATTQETDEDDIDALLESLAAAKQKEITEKPAPNEDDQFENICRLLSINTQNLRAMNEMRRLFGRDAVGAVEAPPQEARPRNRGQRVVQGDGRGFPAISLQRNIFVQGKEEWPRATTGGLGMEYVNQSARFTEYRFIHSTAYQDTQRQYEIAVASMDPQRLILILQQNPYHVATLLQVSEIAKHDREHEAAGEFLEKALFAFGRASHSTFGNNIATGKARLDFDRPENREFFLAGWRYIQNLSMRSTWRTVYEWTKLLVSLSGRADPYALAMVMDQYALRANQAEHYIQLHDAGSDLPMYTQTFYSLALCYLQTGQSELAHETLQKAMIGDRYTAHQLCRDMEIELLPASLWAWREQTNAREALFCEMYCTRAKDLWSIPEAKALLKTVATQLPKADVVPNEDLDTRVTVEEARHVYLTENDTFIRALAKCQVEGGVLLGDRPTLDPYPPVNDVVSYDARPADRRGMAAGITGMGRLPNDQLRMLVQEVARLQMHAGGPGLDDEDIREFDEEEEDDDEHGLF